jgi:hypothetical protein
MKSNGSLNISGTPLTNGVPIVFLFTSWLQVGDNTERRRGW